MLLKASVPYKTKQIPKDQIENHWFGGSFKYVKFCAINNKTHVCFVTVINFSP